MKKLFLFLTLFISTTLYAQPKYALILDAGDITQLHLFQYEQNDHLPAIQEIFAESTPSALAESATNKEAIIPTLTKLFNDANTKLHTLQIDPATVSLEIYGTEKIRSLANEQQNALYQTISQFLQQHYAFHLDHVETISGKMLGAYFWLDANYLAENFQNNTATLGMLNMGNQTFEIAYETFTSSQPENEITLNINHQRHIVFSKSLQNLGQSNVRDAVNQDQLANACYPIDYPPHGAFNQTTCGGIYQTVIQKFQLNNQLLPFGNQQFVTSSAIYQVYNFLEAEIPDRDAFAARMEYACGLPWGSMLEEYDYLSEPQLAVMCANAVFIKQLFYDTLQLQANQLWVTDRIDRSKIDWPLGALLYLLLQ